MLRSTFFTPLRLLLVGALGVVGLPAFACTADDGTRVGVLGGGCIDPVPIITRTGNPTGLVTCSDGSTNRASAVTCEDASRPFLQCDPQHSHGRCKTDADCAAGGYCADFGDGSCACYVSRFPAPCVSDADCPDGRACICDASFGVDNFCEPALCHTNADCASGECGLGRDGCGDVSLACRTPADACRVGADCGTLLRSCSAVSSPNFSCENIRCD